MNFALSGQHLLTVAIIGAGPARVELAATLADILPVWYDMIGGDYEQIRVVLVNRSDEILKGDINSSLRQTAEKSLSDRTVKVELLLNAAVTKVTPLIWRAAQPQQFQTQMSDTGIPTLLDRMIENEKPDMCKDKKMKMLCW